VILLISILLALLFVPWPWSIVVLGLGVIAEVGEVVWGLRLARGWRARTGAEAMIGKTAEVIAACRPLGQVRVNGEIWGAIAEAGADVGDTVRIESIDGLTLKVSAIAHEGSSSEVGPSDP
jgi:membrane protein implicated in regulation of membrane protease activity